MILRDVLKQYRIDADAVQIDALGNAGGFSGAAIWKIQTAQDRLCLRRWPKTHPDRQRLMLIHRSQHAARQAGLRSIPTLLLNREQATYCRADGCFWELSEWLPGTADFAANPNDARLTATMHELARFHQATQPVVDAEPGIPLSIQSRKNIFAALREGELSMIRDAMASSTALNSSLEATGHDLSTKRALQQGNLGQSLLNLVSELLPVLERSFEQYGNVSLPQQICIRDIWHDHLLFEENKLSGIVDFGSLNVDSVTTDLARLLGSLLADEQNRWFEAISAYEQIRPLSELENRMIPILDESATVLSAVNWLKWVFVQNRTFDDLPALVKRLLRLRKRLISLRTRKI